ncbi:MAG TPA: hypothetical protein VGH24_11080, partial [Solirubrobacteraceae bacterium]
AELQAAAHEHHWRLIDAPPAFESHGYCTGENSWVVSYKQSNDRHGDGNGTLHPNLLGQTALADAFYPVVSKALGLTGLRGRPKPRPRGGQGGRPRSGLG